MESPFRGHKPRNVQHVWGPGPSGSAIKRKFHFEAAPAPGAAAGAATIKGAWKLRIKQDARQLPGRSKASTCLPGRRLRSTELKYVLGKCITGKNNKQIVKIRKLFAQRLQAQAHKDVLARTPDRCSLPDTLSLWRQTTSWAPPSSCHKYVFLNYLNSRHWPAVRPRMSCSVSATNCDKLIERVIDIKSL